MKSLMIISGWAHGIKSIEPFKTKFSDKFVVTLIPASEALHMSKLPTTDYIAGISLGGMIAIDKLPVDCQKLVLISTTACFCKKANYPFGTSLRVISKMKERLTENENQVLEDFFNNAHSPQTLKMSKQKKTMNNEGLKDGLAFMAKKDLREKVKLINASALILHGRLDQIVPFASAEWLHNNFKKSDLFCFEKMGHMVSVHAFEKIIKMIDDFLE